MNIPMRKWPIFFKIQPGETLQNLPSKQIVPKIIKHCESSNLVTNSGNDPENQQWGNPCLVTSTSWMEAGQRLRSYEATIIHWSWRRQRTTSGKVASVMLPRWWCWVHQRAKTEMSKDYCFQFAWWVYFCYWTLDPNSAKIGLPYFQWFWNWFCLCNFLKHFLNYKICHFQYIDYYFNIYLDLNVFKNMK